MARWFEVKAKMQSQEELEKKHRLELDNMEVEVFYRPIQLDLDSVVTYSHLYDKEGEIIEGRSEVTLGHGGSIALELEYKELNKAIKNVRPKV